MWSGSRIQKSNLNKVYMKIAVLDGYTSNPGDLSWDAFEELGELTVYDRTKPEEVVSRCAGCEVVFTNKVVMDAGIMDQLPDLKYIGVLATGTNVIDLEYAGEKGNLCDQYSGVWYGLSGAAYSGVYASFQFQGKCTQRGGSSGRLGEFERFLFYIGHAE